MKRKKNGNVELWIALFAILALVGSLYKVDESMGAFHVENVAYSKNGTDFRLIDLPFFANDGYFIINFTTNKKDLRLNFFVGDCIEYGAMNGQKFYQGECTPCKHCRGVRGAGTFDENKVNTLYLKTKTISSRAFVIVENSENDFIWRSLSIIAVLTLIVVAFEKAAGREIREDMSGIYSKAIKNNAIVSLLILSLAIQLFVSQWGQSVDVRDWLVRAENMVHKKDWSFMKLDPDYSFSEAWYMGKPPGAYLYFFIPLRLLFGFNHIYSFYLVKLPPIFGTLLVGYMIWRVLASRIKSRRIPVIAAGMYALNPGVILVSAYLGKHDSLTIGVLLLALANLGMCKFIVYFGLSILGKQLPALMAPWLILQRKQFKETLLAILLFLLLVLPFLIDDPVLFFERLIMMHADKSTIGLSWIVYLDSLGAANVLFISKILLALYLLTITLVAFGTKTDAYVAGAVVFALLVTFSKVVLEQYIMWALPFLIIAYFCTKKKSAMAAFVVGSVSSIIYNEDFKLLPVEILNVLSVILALVYLWAAADLVRGSFSLETVKMRVHKIIRMDMSE
jgi:hypothetical protein